MSTIRQRGTAGVLLLHCIRSISVYRAFTGNTQFPTDEPADPEGCSQGVKRLILYNPLHRDNLLTPCLRISPVQILTHLDNRDHRPGREERRLILRMRHHRHHPLVCSHTLHTKPLRWLHQDRNIPRRATYLHRNLALIEVPPVAVLCLVVATRIIQRLVRHPPPPLYPPLTSY